MTLIAHGILELNKYIKDKKVADLKNKLQGELPDDVKQTIDERLKKALDASADARDKLRKLKRAEKKIDIYGDNGGKFALVKTVGITFALVPLGIAALTYEGVKATADALKTSKAKKEQQKQEIAEKAAEEEKRIAQEKADELEESVEKEEIDLLTRVISNADMVHNHGRADVSTYKNAMVMGLVDEYGQIAEIASEHGRMVFFFDDSQKEKEAKIVNAFFINPETGNFEQIATVKSVRGRSKIISAINGKLAEQRQKHAEQEEAKLRNMQIMAAMKQKQ